jgi:hypothetical protein
MTRPHYADLMAPGLRSIFVQWNDTLQREEEYPLVFHVDPSDSAFEDEAEFAGLPPMPEKPEGESFTYQDLIQGGSVRFINYGYGMGIRASHELFADDKYGLIKQAPVALSRSAHFTREQKAWNVFNLGFTSITTTDGVSLFNNAHPLLGGPNATNVGPGLTNVISSAGTYPNRPATDVDLSFTAIQLMVNQYERAIDAVGLPISVKIKYLVVPPELMFICREILGSAHKPYTADNEVNALLAEDFKFITPHYLTSQSAWFAVSEKESHSLKFYTREALNDDYADDFDTRSVKMTSFMRFATGATTWYGTWGSNGA